MTASEHEMLLKQTVNECQRAFAKATSLYREVFCSQRTDVNEAFREDVAVTSILTPVAGLLQDNVVVAHGEEGGRERYGKICEYVGAAFTAILDGKFGPELNRSVYRSYIEALTDFDAGVEASGDSEFKTRGRQYVLSHLEFSTAFVMGIFSRYAGAGMIGECVKKELDEFYAQMADAFLPVMDVAAARLAGEIE